MYVIRLLSRTEIIAVAHIRPEMTLYSPFKLWSSPTMSHMRTTRETYVSTFNAALLRAASERVPVPVTSPDAQ